MSKTVDLTRSEEHVCGIFAEDPGFVAFRFSSKRPDFGFADFGADVEGIFRWPYFLPQNFLPQNMFF